MSKRRRLCFDVREREAILAGADCRTGVNLLHARRLSRTAERHSLFMQTPPNRSRLTSQKLYSRPPSKHLPAASFVCLLRRGLERRDKSRRLDWRRREPMADSRRICLRRERAVFSCLDNGSMQPALTTRPK